MAQIVSARLKIGMEIHIELATRSKMFTRAASVGHPDHYDSPPNSLVDPVVLGLPGALPVMNKAAIEMAIKVGLALHGTIAEFSKWDRKNYFYPDLPKGYQISQYDLPLCRGGHLDIPGPDGRERRIGIIRAHLEEDTGKLGHELPGGRRYDGSLVDLNRAGTPLLEIVTQPDLASADEAETFARELRNICRFLGVTEGVMQRGHMRFEPNVNVVITDSGGREFATPVIEVKNLNSFKSLRGAIEHEYTRQVEEWQETGRVMGPGAKRTRGWDDARGVTVLQREKEDAHDYRYFPDPDLVPVVVSAEWRDRIAATIPELPMQRRIRYQREFGLSRVDATTLTSERDLCFYYEECLRASDSKSGGGGAGGAGGAIAKLLLNAGARRANERGCEVHELGITPRQVAQIVALRESGQIGSNAADELFGLLCDPRMNGRSAEEIAGERGLIQIRDDGLMEEWIEQAIAAHPQAAADFAAGKDAASGRLVGHVMKASGGRADAATINEKLRAKLRSG